MQKDVVRRILQKMPMVSSETLFDKHWLDFEEIFRKAGWKVE